MKEIIFLKHTIADVSDIFVDITAGQGAKALLLGKVPEYRPLKAVQHDDASTNEAFLSKLFNNYKTAKSRYIIINSLDYTLVPSTFFSSDTKDAMLHATTGDWDKEKETTYCDHWDKEEAYLIYRMPAYITDFIKQESRFIACYHAHTAIRYIVGRKMFIQSPHYIVLTLNSSRRCSIYGMQKNKLLFVQAYEIDTLHDVNYYIHYLIKKFFSIGAAHNIQLHIFTSSKREVEELSRALTNQHKGIIISIFDMDDILHSYRIGFSSYEQQEDFFALSLLSICES